MRFSPRFVTLVPLWMAPNLITIVGLAVNILTSLVLVLYCPTATEVAPWWTTFSCALGLFIYQTLDAIDGKQARRTKTSSPLGELFDHGCDSLSTVFVSIASCCAVRLGLYPGWMLFQVRLSSQSGPVLTSPHVSVSVCLHVVLLRSLADLRLGHPHLRHHRRHGGTDRGDGRHAPFILRELLQPRHLVLQCESSLNIPITLPSVFQTSY